MEAPQLRCRISWWCAARTPARRPNTVASGAHGSAGKADAHLLHAIDERRSQPARRLRQLDVVDACQHAAEDLVELEAREIGPETEVFADPEGQVFVRAAANVEG